MAASGWPALLAGFPWFQGAGRYPIPAYSEFMPPPRVGGRAYALDDPPLWDAKDPCGWTVNETEEFLELRPSLDFIAARVITGLSDLAAGKPVRGLSRYKLDSNPAWPSDLAEAGPLKHESYVLLLPLALSRTQDDKGRVRWTLFGGSEQGPARGFWRGFWSAPRKQMPAQQAEQFIRRLLQSAYAGSRADFKDLRKAGFRVLPCGNDLPQPWWRDGPLPDWVEPYLWDGEGPVASVRYLLTFRPFAVLPPALRRAYLAGRLRLLPCPSSLLFWGTAGSLKLSAELPLAVQFALQHFFERHEGYPGLRVPQAGWMHEYLPDHPALKDPRVAVRNSFQRTHRWDRIHRHDNPLKVLAREDRVAHVLFSTAGDDLGLYGKPMARNVQLWTEDYHLLLDGPRATAGAILDAHRRVQQGGLFGYRFQYPALRVGRHEVYWHRPVIAYRDPYSGEAARLADGPQGYLTAYVANDQDLNHPVELWPRLLHRQPYLDALEIFHQDARPSDLQVTASACILQAARRIRGELLPRTLAARLRVHPDGRPIEEWLASLPEQATDSRRAHQLASAIEECLESEPEKLASPVLTFARTATRPFEVKYWETIAFLSAGRYLNKCNADCVLDPPTQAALIHHHRDLDALGDYLLKYYRRVVRRAGMQRRALVGDIPFRWETDFNFNWMGGWRANQEHQADERDLIVVIPGRDRSRAVIMADHYDTAYMADRYEPQLGGTKARIAAAGADDNHSATAALMLGAPVFLDMSRRGQLGCDVWLIHLTGEEFPADCLGARHLTQLIVEDRMGMRREDGSWHNFCGVRVQGVYVLDMVAHNRDHERDVFQISPGVGRRSFWLAEQAHQSALLWNASVPLWNRRPQRRGKGRGRRSSHPDQIPDVAAHPTLRGEVRLPANPRSTLYNTDGQIFSDAGIPVVLFMENYDINRSGYHDSEDTMANIDLDYGSAVAAIAIESVARAACGQLPST